MTTTLSTLIDSLSSLRASKKLAQRELDSIAGQIETLEGEIMKAMDSEGLLESKSAVGKVTLSESVYPRVEDWDQFYQFIYDNRYFHLLEKRPTALAYRELLSLGKSVPGVLPFTMRKLSFKES